MLLKPRRLRPGDRVALVAPASPFARAEFDAGVAELTKLGFAPVFDESVFARSGFVAGAPALRAAALDAAWQDPSIAAIVAVRGGYGTSQVLPLIDSSVIRRGRKVFVGYSDLTALLCCHVRHGVVCFHGPMVERRLAHGESRYHRPSFLAALTSTEPMGVQAPPGVSVIREGEAAGTLLGGTLTQLTASLGTPWAFDPPERCLLFIEDVNERPYRVHRMLTQLAQAGILDRAAGLVFGELPGCDEPGGTDPTVRQVITEFADDFDGPVLFGFPSGHSVGPMWTLPFGVRARLICAPPALVIEEAAVAEA
ncbi:MAG: S66 peptidase family protein [Acidobacteriota bacterium]